MNEALKGGAEKIGATGDAGAWKNLGEEVEKERRGFLRKLGQAAIAADLAIAAFRTDPFGIQGKKREAEFKERTLEKQKEKEIEAQEAKEREETEIRTRLDRIESQIGGDVRRMMDEKAKDAKEQEEAEQEMLVGMEKFRLDKDFHYKNIVKQERLERELNGKLVTVDDVEGQVLAGNSEVDKREMEYEGKEIPVYDLKGLPFAMLSHAIDYKKENTAGNGESTASLLIEHPIIWRQSRDMIEMEQGGKNARGNTICTSYINSEHNLNTRFNNPRAASICYGFEKVEGDAIVMIGDHDMLSTNDMGGERKVKNHLAEWSELESKVHSSYNEVTLRRYDETGKPRLPDYIIAQNGKITEGMLKHAAAFGIPIINIEEKFYNEKFREKAEKILAEVGEDDDYEKVAGALHEISRMSGKEGRVAAEANATTIDEGYKTGEQWRRENLKGELAGEIMDLGNLELRKRIPFIMETLRREIERVKEATQAGESYDGKAEGLDRFKASKTEMTNGTRVEVDMRLKGDLTEVETSVNENDGAGGVIYGALEPLVTEYEAVRRENQKMGEEIDRAAKV